MPTILIADDEPNIRRMVGALLGAEGYDVCDAVNGGDAIAQALLGDVDVVLIDLMMPGEVDGMAALKRIREKMPELPVIMMSGRAGLSDAVKATKLGAFNFLEKPLTPEGVLLAVGSAVELQRTRRVARELREELGLTGQMVGESDQMQEVRTLIARVAPTDSRVLITGESGTGKELVASAIHDGSSRRDRPFVRVNCAALPRDLVESEMFGHERGAFTGATQARAGRFELAHTGTLFLDEVADLSAEAQSKLLRAIEAREIQRVGGNKTLNVDVRVIAATNRDLQAAVRTGEFREDLYFRLAVLPIALPPLRQRRGDIASLIRHFSEQYRKRVGQQPRVWTPEALEVMHAYAWPGNIRELANIVERLAILHPGAPITGHTIHEMLFSGDGTDSHFSSDLTERGDMGHLPLNEKMDAFERKLITRALGLSSGNVSDAARTLDTDRANLYRRMKRLGIALALLLTALPSVALGQQASDSSTTDTVPDLRALWRRAPDESGLQITSGKSYNRVEGLPVLLGPVYRDSGSRVTTRIALFGIIRTANRFDWDSRNLGHLATAGFRFGPERKIGFDAASYDIVEGTQPWQLGEPEAGLAAFFLHRDYNDYFGRHGGSMAGSFSLGVRSRLQLEVRDERWSSLAVRDVFTVLRNGNSWRENPRFDDGRVHILATSVIVDTRNDTWAPLFGWYLNANYENGRGQYDSFGPASLLARSAPGKRAAYGRLFVDLRRYNRISPRDHVNMRLVLGGWLHGDDLPMQRRFSVGGVGTIPGFDYRSRRGNDDLAQCSDFPVLPGNPAQCERLALVQLEYRSLLGEKVFDGIQLGRYGGRVVLRPSLVAFVDAGRGWLVGPRLRNIRYSSTAVPDLSTFLTDVGVGFDVGFGALYVAKAVSLAGEPANVFLRIRRRF